MTPKQAFLDTIAFSEGTDFNPKQKTKDRGYDVIVGGALFTGYDNPQRFSVWLPKLGIYSSAIGRYQCLYRYAVHYIDQLRLHDFGPASQDAIAWQLIGECGAKDDVLAGRFPQAVIKCRSRWASLPGAGYGQHENSMKRLEDFYNARMGI